MHIPKTAGESLNDFIGLHYPGSEIKTHIETTQEWICNKDISNLMAKYTFISGHVCYPWLLERVGNISHFKFTIIREPYSQVISHLAWVRHLGEPYNRLLYDAHPKPVQDIVDKMWCYDFKDLHLLDKYIKSLSEIERNLFDNFQLKMFSGIDRKRTLATEEEVSLAKKHAKDFDLIGFVENYDESVRILCEKMEWPKPASFKSINVTKNFYDLNKSDESVKEILEPLVQYDIILYNFFKEKS